MRKKRFSTHVFLEQLQKRNMQSKMHRKQTPGMFRIIEYLYAGVDASKVDFDSFTLDELEYVYNEAHALYSMEDIYEKMTANAGIVRNEQGLTSLRNWLEQFDFLQIDRSRLSKENIEIVNMLTVGWLIATSALERKESIGSHYRSDCPPAEPAGDEHIRREILRQINQERVSRR